MWFKSRFAAACITLAIGSAGVVSTHANAADDVIMRINFTPWGMHAQYFAGQAQGIYEAEGINIEIRPPSAGQLNESIIATGREHFGVTNVDSFTKARANGLPVRAIMMDQPDMPFAVITLESSGISAPEHMQGKRIGLFQSTGAGMIRPFLEAGGLTDADVTLVNIARGTENQLLASGEVDAIIGFSYGQALTLEDRGIPVNVMPLKDFGVTTYGTVIYTNDMLIEQNPELVQRFVAATVKALEWTADNKRDAVAEVIKVSPDRDLDLETRKLEIIYGIYNSPDYADAFGVMTADKWASTIDFYIETGEFDSRPDENEIFTNDFISNVPEAVTLAEKVRQ
jgi:NitT/TauT family transport system substrate-binding protein